MMHTPGISRDQGILTLVAGLHERQSSAVGPEHS